MRSGVLGLSLPNDLLALSQTVCELVLAPSLSLLATVCLLLLWPGVTLTPNYVLLWLFSARVFLCPLFLTLSVLYHRANTVDLPYLDDY